MTVTREQLLHLANRARRGVLLPDEGALLADAVKELTEELVNAQHDNEFMKLLVAASSTDGHTVRRTAQKLAALDRVRAIHRDAYPGTADTGRSCTAGCGTWPCATLTALDPAQQPTA